MHKILTNISIGDTINTYQFIQTKHKEENCMKKFYTKPELEVTELLAEDILTASLENEVEMDGSDLFGE